MAASQSLHTTTFGLAADPSLPVTYGRQAGILRLAEASASPGALAVHGEAMPTFAMRAAPLPHDARGSLKMYRSGMPNVTFTLETVPTPSR